MGIRGYDRDNLKLQPRQCWDFWDSTFFQKFACLSYVVFLSCE